MIRRTMEPPQKPVADPLTRAAVEANAERRTAAEMRRRPTDVDPGRARMTHVLDQEDAEMRDGAEVEPFGLPVWPPKGARLPKELLGKI
jgi:hypothetical protein